MERLSGFGIQCLAGVWNSFRMPASSSYFQSNSCGIMKSTFSWFSHVSMEPDSLENNLYWAPNTVVIQNATWLLPRSLWHIGYIMYRVLASAHGIGFSAQLPSRSALSYSLRKRSYRPVICRLQCRTSEWSVMPLQLTINVRVLTQLLHLNLTIAMMTRSDRPRLRTIDTVLEPDVWSVGHIRTAGHVVIFGCVNCPWNKQINT